MVEFVNGKIYLNRYKMETILNIQRSICHIFGNQSHSTKVGYEKPLSFYILCFIYIPKVTKYQSIKDIHCTIMVKVTQSIQFYYVLYIYTKLVYSYFLKMVFIALKAL